MKRYFIIVPKDEFTEEMESLFLRNRESNDNNYVMGMICNDIPSIFDGYTILTKHEYHQKIADEPELWVPDEVKLK